MSHHPLVCLQIRFFILGCGGESKFQENSRILSKFKVFQEVIAIKTY